MKPLSALIFTSDAMMFEWAKCKKLNQLLLETTPSLEQKCTEAIAELTKYLSNSG